MDRQSVAFAGPTGPLIMVTFTEPGEYVLRLTADEAGVLQAQPPSAEDRARKFLRQVAGRIRQASGTGDARSSGASHCATSATEDRSRRDGEENSTRRQ